MISEQMKQLIDNLYISLKPEKPFDKTLNDFSDELHQAVKDEFYGIEDLPPIDSEYIMSILDMWEETRCHYPTIAKGFLFSYKGPGFHDFKNYCLENFGSQMPVHLIEGSWEWLGGMLGELRLG